MSISRRKLKAKLSGGKAKEEIKGRIKISVNKAVNIRVFYSRL
jgi:hypothetical protein